MPITIHYEINGQSTLLQPHATTSHRDELDNGLLRLGSLLAQRLAYLTCLEHQQPPSITVLASPGGQSGFRIQGCCAELVSTTRQAIHILLAEMNPARESGRWLTLTNSSTGMTLCVDGTTIGDQWVIGRHDADSDVKPEIDLSEQAAAEKDVSRQHAALLWQAGAFFIMDLASTNKSFLNDDPLFSHKPYRLRHDDRLRLGKLTFHVHIL